METKLTDCLDLPRAVDPQAGLEASALGEAMDIAAVAFLLGCSPWTVRQRYLPQGLPHLRASATGKFIFFREQVIAWILERQKKGHAR